MKNKTDALITREASPYNSEPSPTDLSRDYTTPTELFYCRNHGTIPEISAENYRLTLGGLVSDPREFSLGELKKFPAVTANYTLQCAGNRRSEFEQFTGTPWQSGAIGNAVWKGLRLRDLLDAVGLTDEAAHVHFVGLDETEKEGETLPFGMSITRATALREETLLAYEMNGEPLSSLHGFPLRAMVPGLIAARSVKWLDRIELAAAPTDNPHYSRDYKFVPLGIDEDDIPWEGMPAIASYQMTSAICQPENDAKVRAGKVKVRGYAIAEGHQDTVIERVEVKIDGEKDWLPAPIVSDREPFCWCLWEVEIPLKAGDHRLSVRAWDSRGRMQPQNPNPNLKGYLNEGWHQVQVHVE